jgi:hypothetical protein
MHRTCYNMGYVLAIYSASGFHATLKFDISPVTKEIHRTLLNLLGKIRPHGASSYPLFDPGFDRFFRPLAVSCQLIIIMRVAGFVPLTRLVWDG